MLSRIIKNCRCLLVFAVDDTVRNTAGQDIYFAMASANVAAGANSYSQARVEYTNVWTISAIDFNGDFASFSDYGKPPVEYAAQGVDVESLWRNNRTNTISGTSMASPHAAAVLLLINGNPNSDRKPDPIIHY